MIKLRKCIAAALFLLFCHTAQAAAAEPVHAIAMHGTPRYAADFTHFDYVNPAAPKGGDLKLAKNGSFDNLNNHIITGNNVEGTEFLNDKLMVRAWNEPFTMYGLVAQSVEVADDRSWIVFNLNPAARFHDGTPMTVDDVRFSFDHYRTKGHPVRRRVYGLVTDIETSGLHRIKFTFGQGYDAESILILAMMPVLPKHYWEKADLSKTTLTPPLGSGPYKIKSVDPGRKIVYERVKDWWAKDLPVNAGLYNFDTISYTYFRDDDIALQAFKAGEYNLRREYDVTKWATNYDFQSLKEGKVVREAIPHHRPEWLKALVFNTRRPVFADARVRRALGLMFNDEFLNKNLYGGLLNRINSAFPNSELAAQGIPAGEELNLLTQYKNDLPDAVFGAPWQPAQGSLRDRQREAIALLKQAGWRFDNQRLVNAKGEDFSFEILLGDPNEEKIALEFTRALSKLGIKARVRTVDSAQFSGRLENYDYDMVAYRWINSLSPGNEQVNYWGKLSAATNGGRNYAGVSSDAVDAIADSIARAKSREDLVARCRALDRALMWGDYMIPLFYSGKDMVSYENSLKRPELTPVYGIVLESWWREK